MKIQRAALLHLAKGKACFLFFLCCPIPIPGDTEREESSPLSVVCVCERERVYSHGTDRENTSTNKLFSTSWWQKHGLDPRQLWTGNPVDRVATDRVMGQSVLAQGAMESGFPEWRMWGQIWKEGEKWTWREERSESTRTQGLAFAQW